MPTSRYEFANPRRRAQDLLNSRDRRCRLATNVGADSTANPTDMPVVARAENHCHTYRRNSWYYFRGFLWQKAKWETKVTSQRSSEASFPSGSKHRRMAYDERPPVVSVTRLRVRSWRYLLSSSSSFFAVRCSRQAR